MALKNDPTILEAAGDGVGLFDPEIQNSIVSHTTPRSSSLSICSRSRQSLAPASSALASELSGRPSELRLRTDVADVARAYVAPGLTLRVIQAASSFDGSSAVTFHVFLPGN